MFLLTATLIKDNKTPLNMILKLRSHTMLLPLFLFYFNFLYFFLFCIIRSVHIPHMWTRLQELLCIGIEARVSDVVLKQMILGTSPVSGWLVCLNAADVHWHRGVEANDSRH